MVSKIQPQTQNGKIRKLNFFKDEYSKECDIPYSTDIGCDIIFMSQRITSVAATAMNQNLIPFICFTIALK